MPTELLLGGAELELGATEEELLDDETPPLGEDETPEDDKMLLCPWQTSTTEPPTCEQSETVTVCMQAPVNSWQL